MSPSKTVAALTLGALLLLPGLAVAQTPPYTDLVVAKVEYGGERRVVGVAAPINITIANEGTADFSSPTGWQIFVSLGGRSDGSCITRNEAVPVGATSACYIRFTAATPNANIPAGQTRTYSITWTATSEQFTPTVEGKRMYVEIGPIGDPGRWQSDNLCEGPDQRCHGNLWSLDIRVGRAGVRAEPMRDKPDVFDATKNTPWPADQIKTSCPTEESGEAVTRGCIAKPGKRIVATYLVTNSGTVRDSYVPSLIDPNGDLRVAYYTVDAVPVLIDPGADELVKVIIGVPENATAQSDYNTQSPRLKMRWTSTVNGAVHTNLQNGPGCTGDVADYCTDPTLPSWIVDYRYGFNITSNETFKQIEPGVPAQFNLTVLNTGNWPDRFNVTLDNATGNIAGWSTSVSWTATIQPNETGNASIRLNPPNGALNGSYHFRLVVASLNDQSRENSAPCRAFTPQIPGAVEDRGRATCGLDFTAHLGQAWAIRGMPAVASQNVPGEPVEYKLGVKNDGNGWDNITLELQASIGGWEARLSNTTLRMPPGTTHPFTLTVVPPPGTAPGTVAAFFVNATSSGPHDRPLNERSQFSLENRHTVLQGPNIALVAPVNSTFVDAGAASSYDLLITNTGNVADKFNVTLERQHTFWGATVEPSEVTLQPNQQTSVRVTVVAPGPTTAQVGDRTNVIATVKSTADPSRAKQTTFEARVSGPDLFVDNVVVDPATPYSGDPVRVDVVAGNTGNKIANANVTLRVYFVQGGVERIIGERKFLPSELPAQRRLTESFAWNTKDIEGAGMLLARIDVDDIVREIDDTAASNERTRAVTLRTLKLEVKPAAGLTARPGEEVSYGEEPNAFLVTYSGNQANEPVTIRFESEHGWLASQSELSIALPRNTPVPILAKLAIPALPGAGKDTLTMRVTPSLRPEAAVTVSTVTTVLDEQNPRILSIVPVPAVSVIGESVNLDVRVEDATGVTAVTLYVTLPTNETQGVVATRVAGDLWRATQPFTVAGPYRVSAEATDAADPPNRNRSRALTSAFTVNPGSAPVVALAEGQGTTVRTGSFIRLDIRDPLGIGKATYTLLGVTYDLRGPVYQIDTSAFPSGEVDLTVTAENIYGVKTAKRFGITVDNTPPGITRVTMSPPQPLANEDVTITVQTESQVQSVDVLVKRDGQVVETLNATRKGTGRFEVKYNAPEGDYRLDVTARDVAGNANLAESAVVFTAKKDSVPGPAAALATLAALGAALALRRRR